MSETLSLTGGPRRAAPLPRLLMVSNFLPPGRGSRSVQQDVRDRLAALGYPIVVASPIRNGMARGAHMVAVAIARRNDYDVATVDVYSGRAFLWADVLSRLLQRMRRPFVLMLHGGNLPQLAAERPERLSRCLTRATAAAAPSAYLRERLRCCRADIELLPNGVDLDRCAFRARRNIAPHLVWLRAMHAVYNPVMAVETLAALKARFPDATLTMVGPDKGDGTLGAVQSAVAKRGLEGSVRLIGGVDKPDVPRRLQEGDIFLNTTNVDNTPVSVLEAMACGLPVVSTNVGGLPYLLHHGRDALLVPAGMTNAMADAVMRLLDQSDLAADLSANGRAAVEPFRWSTVIAGWTNLLDRVARGAPAPSRGRVSLRSGERI